MLLGKRPRPPMQRTTSMSGISIDIPNNNNSSAEMSNTDQQPLPFGNIYNNNLDVNINSSSSKSDNSFNHHQGFMVSPSNITRRNSVDFLTTCGLCKRRLAAGKDIYMYRGDTAFCSQECRERQMKQEDHASH
ncbi:hypothetical protein M5689_013294 [Euphorbia peplus]|nr:hypothetical protein M5689_013294 [Euphorbia peplus]